MKTSLAVEISHMKLYDFCTLTPRRFQIWAHSQTLKKCLPIEMTYRIICCSTRTGEELEDQFTTREILKRSRELVKQRRPSFCTRNAHAIYQ